MIAASAETEPRFAVLPPRSAAAPVTAVAAQNAASDASGSSGDEAPSFLDFIDAINPLQHLPVISTLYREITGDTLSPGARIAGDILYGGVIGAISGIGNALSESLTGKDFGQHVLALLFGSEEPAKGGSPATLTAHGTADAPVKPAAIEPAPVAPVAVDPGLARPAVPITVAALSVTPAIVQPSDPAPSAGMESSDGATVVDSRQVIFAPPARSRLPLAPSHKSQPPAEAASRNQARPQPPIAPLLDRAPLFAVTPPPPAPLFGPGPVRTPTAAQAAAAAAAPAGSAALEGGWFSEAMLSGLHKYQQEPARKPQTASADVTGSTPAASH